MGKLCDSKYLNTQCWALSLRSASLFSLVIVIYLLLDLQSHSNWILDKYFYQDKQEPDDFNP